MPTRIDPVEIERNVVKTLEHFVNKRPVLEPILAAFGEVLLEKARVVGKLANGSRSRSLSLDSTRLLKGMPLLAGVCLDTVREDLDSSFESMASVFQSAFGSLAQDISRLGTLRRGNGPGLSALSRAFLDGDALLLRDSALSALVPEGVLNLVVGFALAPVLQAATLLYQKEAREAGWLRGYCPVCGSMPSVAFLAEADTVGSEFLKGGGGQKYLHCFLCGCQWRVMRTACPACESEDKDHRFYFQIQGEGAERVDVCLKCSGYLPCLDLREMGFKPAMDMAAVAMVHLDAWARGKGYHPLAVTPWSQAA